MATTTQNPAGRLATSKGVSSVGPDIEMRLSPLYPWTAMVFAVIFFFLGLFVASPAAKGGSVAMGFLICVVAAGGVYGANYWRQHLPIVARMTARQLILFRQSRRVTIDWTNIAELKKKTWKIPSHGIRQTSELVLIKLKTPLPPDAGLNKLPALQKLNDALVSVGKGAFLDGFDLFVNPLDEFMRTADWFLEECQKRIAAATTTR